MRSFSRTLKGNLFIYLQLELQSFGALVQFKKEQNNRKKSYQDMISFQNRYLYYLPVVSLCTYIQEKDKIWFKKLSPPQEMLSYQLYVEKSNDLPSIRNLFLSLGLTPISCVVSHSWFFDMVFLLMDICCFFLDKVRTN